MTDPICRLSGVAILLFILIGCSSGIGADPKALAIETLQGGFDLNTEARPVEPAGDDGFKLVSERLEIFAETLTFIPTYSGVRPFVLAGNTLTLTDDDGDLDVVQASLSDNGNVLTLVDDIGTDVVTFVFIRRERTAGSNQVSAANLQGTYDLDAARTIAKSLENLVAGELKIAGSVLKASLTFSQTRPFELARDTITLTEADGTTTELRAALSDDAKTLTLTFIESRETYVFDRR